MEKKCTSFSTIYDVFTTRVTSDMYMELSELDTLRQLQDLLIAAIPRFKFPKFNSFDYDPVFAKFDAFAMKKDIMIV